MPGQPTQRGWLERLNPLAKLGAALPQSAALVLLDAPPASLATALLAVFLLCWGTRPHLRTVLLATAAATLTLTVLVAAISMWSAPERTAVGGWSDTVLLGAGAAGPITASTLGVAAATALRLAALVALTGLAGARTSRTALVRALTDQLRMPYRIGFAVYAASGFLGRFRAELATIRDAERVRGGRRRHPISRWPQRGVLLLASALRHADHMALAMESRSFGAFPDRTRRITSVWRWSDTAWLTTGLLIAATTLALTAAGLVPNTAALLHSLRSVGT